MTNSTEKHQYKIIKAPGKPPKIANREDPFWKICEPASISFFRKEGSSHRPDTQFKATWSDSYIHVIFRVTDQYVRAVSTNFGEPVYEDSCVEFFIEPVPGAGYFNLETNCIGTLLMYHVIDPERRGAVFADYRKVSPEEASAIEISTSLPKGIIIEPEISHPVIWSLQYSIPFSLLSALTGMPFKPVKGTVIRGNFFKCGDKTSHPHWGSWQEVKGDLNFHQPACFGELLFA